MYYLFIGMDVFLALTIVMVWLGIVSCRVGSTFNHHDVLDFIYVMISIVHVYIMIVSLFQESRYCKMTHNPVSHVAELVISEACPEDGGVYLCKAESEAGYAETSCSLKIKGQ